MNHRASVGEVARNFSDYVDRVADRGERFVLTRGGKPVAELRPVATPRTLGDLAAFLASTPRLAKENAEAYAADLQDARDELDSIPLRDPWDS